jgi:hypothetical protein
MWTLLNPFKFCDPEGYSDLMSRSVPMFDGSNINFWAGTRNEWPCINEEPAYLCLVSWDGVRLSPLGTPATNWPISWAPDDRWWVWSSRWNDNWQGKPKYSQKTCPSAALSTTNPIWLDLGWNRDRRSGKPATNRLSYGTAWRSVYFAKQNMCHWNQFDIYRDITLKRVDLYLRNY